MAFPAKHTLRFGNVEMTGTKVYEANSASPFEPERWAFYINAEALNTRINRTKTIPKFRGTALLKYDERAGHYFYFYTVDVETKTKFEQLYFAVEDSTHPSGIKYCEVYGKPKPSYLSGTIIAPPPTCPWPTASVSMPPEMAEAFGQRLRDAVLLHLAPTNPIITAAMS